MTAITTNVQKDYKELIFKLNELQGNDFSIKTILKKTLKKELRLLKNKSLFTVMGTLKYITSYNYENVSFFYSDYKVSESTKDLVIENLNKKIDNIEQKYTPIVYNVLEIKFVYISV